MKKKIIAILSCFFLLSTTTNAQDLHYSNQQYHYSFTLPSSWVEIPKSSIDKAMQQAADMTKGEFIDYLTGFQIESADFFQYPYILVQQHDVNTPSYGQIAQTFEGDDFSKGINEKVEEYSELIANSSFQTPFIDKDKNIVFMSLEMDVAAVGRVKGLVAMLLGKSSITQLNFYSVESEYTENLLIFNQIINSFKYEQKYEYDAEEAKKNDSISISEVLKKSIIGGIIGALVGLVWAFFSKKKQKKEEDSL